MFTQKSMSLIIALVATLSIFSQKSYANKPTIAVVDFDIKARRASRQFGSELKEMLMNALVGTGKFTVVERSKLNALTEEQTRGLWGQVDQSTAPSVGNMLGAQILAIGTLTEFEEKESGGAVNLLKKSLFRKNRLLGKLGMYKSHIGFTIRLVDTNTGSVIAMKSFDKKVNKVGMATRSVYGVRSSGGFYSSESMQNAIEQAIVEAVDMIVAETGSITTHSPGKTIEAEKQKATNVECSNFSGVGGKKVMVVIPEVHLSRRIPDPAGETEIIKQFLEKGFNVVDQSQIAAIRNQEKVLNCIDDPACAAALGVEFGADVIVIGEAFSERAGRRNGMISCRARVEARVIRTHTGQIIAADGRHGTGLDIAENVAAKSALRNAGSQIADYFIVQICEKEQNIGSTPVVTEIMLADASYMKLKKFTKGLETINGIANVEKNLTGSVARVQVHFSGSSEDLADVISETSFPGAKFEITGLSPGKIDMSIVQ